MRTHGFRTHVLVAVAAAVGVIAALGRPWYAVARAPAEEDPASIGTLHGPVNGLTEAMTRWVSETSGTTGWEALGAWGVVLAALAGLTAAGGLGCLVAPIQGVAREGLRYGAVAGFGVAVWKLIDSPGPNAALEPRYGAFVAVAAALLAASAGSAAAAAPLRSRGVRPAAYVPPAPPRA
jgi:hypothetical protein